MSEINAPEVYVNKAAASKEPDQVQSVDPVKGDDVKVALASALH